MKRWTIGQVATKSGVPATTIRYYEKIGLLPTAERESGQRRYGEVILSRLGVIRLAQQAGFTIAETHALLHQFDPDAPPPTRWQALAAHKMVDVEAQIQALQTMRGLLEKTLQCQCASLEECATRALRG